MAQYHRGRAFEHAVRAALVADGYDVVRSAGSKTKIDLIAFKTSQVLLVQCKVDGKISPAERGSLLRVAGQIPEYAVPLLAYKQPRSSTVYYSRLLGLGPRERAPWTPDEVATGVLPLMDAVLAAIDGANLDLGNARDAIITLFEDRLAGVAS